MTKAIITRPFDEAALESAHSLLTKKGNTAKALVDCPSVRFGGLYFFDHTHNAHALALDWDGFESWVQRQQQNFPPVALQAFECCCSVESVGGDHKLSADGGGAGVDQGDGPFGEVRGCGTVGHGAVDDQGEGAGGQLYVGVVGACFGAADRDGVGACADLV